MAEHIKNAFEKIQASEDLKASTKDFLREKRMAQAQASRPKPKINSWIPRLSTALAVICVAVLGINGYSYMNTPVSYISIDVNPSIELSLNGMDRVISATAYNEDGETILNGTSAVKGKKYEQALDIILESEALQPYLTPDCELTFTVASSQTEKEAVLLEDISQLSVCQNHIGKSTSAAIELIDEAHSHDFSVGKYKVSLELTECDKTIQLEDCRSMTMAEIRSLINAHKQDSENAWNSSNPNSFNNEMHGGSDNRFNGGNSNAGSPFGHGNVQNDTHGQNHWQTNNSQASNSSQQNQSNNQNQGQHHWQNNNSQASNNDNADNRPSGNQNNGLNDENADNQNSQTPTNQMQNNQQDGNQTNQQSNPQNKPNSQNDNKSNNQNNQNKQNKPHNSAGHSN